MTTVLNTLARNEATAQFFKEWRAGRAMYWPVNEVAQHLCKLAGVRALSDDNLTHVRKLGFMVEDTVVNPIQNPRGTQAKAVAMIFMLAVCFIASSAHAKPWPAVLHYPTRFVLDPFQSKPKPMVYGVGPSWDDHSVPYYSEWEHVVAEAGKDSPAHEFTGDIEQLLARVKKHFPNSRYRSDAGNWLTPQDFAETGGDCESFAIAQYYALIEMGVRDNRLFMASFKNRDSNHMILVIDDTWVLDNTQERVTVFQTYREQFTFVPFKINRDGFEAFDFNAGDSHG